MTVETDPVMFPQRLTQPRIKKVFLGLRTNFFGDLVEGEHITLKYFHDTTFADLIHYGRELSQHVPTEITLNGFANWKAAGIYYEVALVDAFTNPRLFDFVRTPHVTIRKSDKPVSNATFNPNYYSESEVIDTLWVGKKSKGKFIWMPVDSRPIGALREEWGELND